MSAGELDDYVGLRHRVLPRPELDATLADLVTARETGDRNRFKRLRDVIVSASVRFVLGVVRRWRGRGLEIEDLLQCGLLGMVRALDSYDPREGAANLWAYARIAIRRVVARAIDNLGSLVRRPPHVHDVARKLSRVGGKWREARGREPTVEEIADLAALSVAAVERCLALGSGAARSLDAPIEADDGGGDTHLDMLTDDEAESPEDVLLRREREAEALGRLAALPNRERDTLAARFFGKDGEGWTLDEVADPLGVSREGARLIEARAFERLRRPRLVPPAPLWRQALAARAAEQAARGRGRGGRRLVRPPVNAPFPEAPSPPRGSPKMRATVKGKAAIIDDMRESTSLGEMIRIERELEEAARVRRKRAKAAADARQGARAKEKRDAKRAEAEAHAERVARVLNEMRARNRARASSSASPT